MKPGSPSTINDFWKWFDAVHSHFGKHFENQSLVDELDSRIANMGNYSWEIGPGFRNPDNSMLVFSPSGDAQILEDTRNIVDRAPFIAGWEFYPAKPPKQWNRVFCMQISSNEIIDARSWSYVAHAENPGRFRLVIVAPALNNMSPILRTIAAEIFLDGEVGEAERIHRISSIEVVTSCDPEFALKSRPIAELAATILS